MYKDNDLYLEALDLSLTFLRGFKSLKIDNRMYSVNILLNEYRIWSVIDNNNDKCVDIENNLYQSTFNIIEEIVNNSKNIETFLPSIYNLLFIDILHVIKTNANGLYNAFYMTSCADDKVEVIREFISYILKSHFNITNEYNGIIDIPDTEFVNGKSDDSVILAEHKSIISYQLGSNTTYRKEVVALDMNNLYNFYHNTLFIETQDYKTRSVQYWYKTNLEGIKSILINFNSTKSHIKDILIKIASLYLVYNLDNSYVSIEKFMTDRRLNELLKEGFM